MVLPSLLESAGFAGPVCTANMFQCQAEVGAYDFVFGSDRKRVAVPCVQGDALAYKSSQSPDYLVAVDTLGDRAYLVSAARFADRTLAKVELKRAAIGTVVLSNIRSPGTHSV